MLDLSITKHYLQIDSSSSYDFNRGFTATVYPPLRQTRYRVDVLECKLTSSISYDRLYGNNIKFARIVITFPVRHELLFKIDKDRFGNGRTVDLTGNYISSPSFNVYQESQTVSIAPPDYISSVGDDGVHPLNSSGNRLVLKLVFVRVGW